MALSATTKLVLITLAAKLLPDLPIVFYLTNATAVSTIKAAKVKTKWADYCISMLEQLAETRPPYQSNFNPNGYKGFGLKAAWNSRGCAGGYNCRKS